MTAATVQFIDVTRIGKMRSANAFGQRILMPRRRHDMHVIRHQAIGMDRQPVLLSLGLQHQQVLSSIVIDEETS